MQTYHLSLGAGQTVEMYRSEFGHDGSSVWVWISPVVPACGELHFRLLTLNAVARLITRRLAVSLAATYEYVHFLELLVIYLS